ncbi:MAG: DUF4012 domain-containing protein [Candidatus Levyibacteriota bacterium]|nr:MAG: DUF4012 domain-containing protein [Candidatus Levybacteria bacterium]
MGKAAKSMLLFLDKKGYIGQTVVALLQKHKSNIPTVFVTGASFDTEVKDVLIVSFKRKIPLLPDALYSHIVVVYNGEQEIFDVLDLLAKKAHETKGKLIVVVPHNFETSKITNLIKELYKETIIVYVGDIFYEKALPENSDIQRFFHQAKKEGSITVLGMGLTKTYPVHLNDVGLGILEILFENTNKDQTFFFFPKHPPTKLSLARMFQKIDPILRVDFVGEEKQEVEYTNKEGNFFLPASYPLEKRIGDVYGVMEVKDIDVVKESEDEEKKKRGGKFVFFTIYALLVFLLLPLIATFSFSFFGHRQLNLVKEAFKKGNILEAQKKGESAYIFFKGAENISRVLIIQADILYLSSFGNSMQSKINAGQKASLIASSFAASINNFLQGKIGISSLRQAIFLSQEIKTQNQKLPSDFFETGAITGVVDVIPKALGFYDEKTYLILFQNNMELRPGGGFIGSYGIVKLKAGRITDFSIHDVYDADGQLKGHVEPPFAIRRYLKSAHWYLRDSNFDIDFRKSASASAFFLQKETGASVDGVVAVDVSFAKSILKVIGDVEVLEYKETITPDNLYQLTQKHAEEDSFAGSSQKKDFLISLFKAIQAKIIDGKITHLALFQLIEKAVREKHLLFAFADSKLQDVFTANNMSSAIWPVKTTDFVGIIEANLGVNKVNVLVTRKVDQQVNIGKEGEVLEKVTITYDNKSKSLDYKNYLRIILPFGTKLSSIAIDGKEQTVAPAIADPSVYEKKGFNPPKGIEVQQETEGEKAVFGVLLIVPSNAEKEISFSYELPQKMEENAGYDLWLFKQPGIDEYPYTLIVSYPDTIRLLSSSHGLEAKTGKIVLEKQVSEDEHIQIKFAKK